MANADPNMPQPQRKRRRGTAAAPAVQQLRLRNGVDMPAVALGTAFFPGGRREPELAWDAVPRALDAGYRHIDTAHMYATERHVGDTLGRYFADGRLARDDVFVTTKVAHPPNGPVVPTEYMLPAWEGDAGPPLTRQFYGCLERLGLGYVDLLLMHWPGPYGSCGVGDAESNRRKRREMWAAMEALYDAGLARAVGVSNFTAAHLDELLGGCRVKPHVNQIELHPYLAQDELVALCRAEGIAVAAYSPLCGAKVSPGPLAEPCVRRIAQRVGASPGQVVLAWLLRRGVAVLPRSSDAARLRENLAAAADPPPWRLTDGDDAELAALARGVHTCCDPATIP